MIQLYVKGNENYTNNGNHVLHPESCELELELSGTWKLTLVYPIDSKGIFKEIINEAVIAAPTPMNNKQLFRIYNTVKNDDDVTAYARPIFYDSIHDTMLIDVRPTDKTGQNALNIMCAGTKYKATSNITDISTAYYQYKNLVAALFGDDENSFVNRWGGEPVFDNYTAVINKRAGADNGVRVEFGRNLDGIEETINMENVVTRIYPKAYNGYTLENNGYVDSQLINNYAIVYSKEIVFDDVKLQSDCQDDEVGYANIDYLRAELIRRCNLEYENGIDLPETSYTVNMIDLSRMIEYKEFKQLETVGIGDTLHVRHRKLGIETSVRCIRLVYDCILQKNISEELGDATTDFIDNVNVTISKTSNNYNSDGSVKAERISGVIDAMNTVLKASRNIAEKQQARAVLFEDLDHNSPTFGAMALGTTGFCIASRQDVNGEWIWNTFGTGQGFLADYVIAGILISRNYIEGKQGIKLNLDEGTLEANSLVIKGKGAPDYIDDAVKALIENIDKYDIYTVSEIPTLDNYPANEWHDYEPHLHSVAYTADGTCYVFRLVDGVYKWEIMQGTDISYVLSKLAELKITDDEITAEVSQTNERLTNGYYTIEQTNSKITQTANEINQNVSKNYTTLTEVGKIKKDLQSEISQTAESIESTVSETYTTKDTTTKLQSQVTQNATSIKSKVSTGDVSSVISQEAGAVSIKSNRFSWDSDNSALSSNGYLDLYGGSIYMKSLSNTAQVIRLASDTGHKCNISVFQLDFVGSTGTQSYMNNSGVSAPLGKFNNLSVSGTKNRIVDTNTYGKLAMNAFETMGAHFADVGSGEIIKDVAVIIFDVKFIEVIEGTVNYNVLITNTSDKKIDYIKKYDGYVEVYGEAGTTFDWMIIAKQRDYADLYADMYDEYQEEEQINIPMTLDELELESLNTDYDAIYDEILAEQEREVTLI